MRRPDYRYTKMDGAGPVELRIRFKNEQNHDGPVDGDVYLIKHDGKWWFSANPPAVRCGPFPDLGCARDWWRGVFRRAQTLVRLGAFVTLYAAAVAATREDRC